MPADADVIQAHSVAEAYLYVSVTPCRLCEKGPLHASGELKRTAETPGGWTLTARCSSCGQDERLAYSIHPPPSRASAVSNVINPTSERSRAIDLLGWLALYRSILTASTNEPDKTRARDLALEATQCLDEVLKFYDGENDLPGEDAFFSEQSRRRLRDHPQQFLRSRWLHERSRLPDARRAVPPERPVRRRSRWRFWRRANEQG